jgi:hypothetical protein
LADWPRPSTYTPLFRRFGSERDRELREAAALHAWVVAHDEQLSRALAGLTRTITRETDGISPPLRTSLVQLLASLLADEPYLQPTPDSQFERMSMQEFVEFRRLLYQKQHFLQNQAAYIDQVEEVLRRVAWGFAEVLPDAEASSPFAIPLVFELPEPADVIQGIQQMLGGCHDRGLFANVRRQLFVNLCEASGRRPGDDSRRPYRYPLESGLMPAELVDTYLKGTPFHEFLLTPIPLALSHEARFNHWHVLAGSGQGKTVLIENLIRYDLACDDPPSIILIDPHSDLVRKLARSDLGIEDRLILIDPRDTQHPVGLNPFAVNRERFGKYDAATQEQVTAGVLQTFGFLWSGLTNLTLTGKQDVFFRYVTRLMLTLPEVEGRNATILDMLQLMQDPAPYRRAIEALPDIPREFFARDFMSKSFEGTKEQVRYRLQAIIESPTMARLFTAPETTIDFFTEMNRGGVILVDTAKDFLKEGSAIFGKLIISLILQAVLERAALPEAERAPTFLMVDEAGSYFSSNIDDLLTEARKYRCGLLLAHQYLDQASSSLRASLAANAGIKFAGGLSAQDAAVMAREMRTTPDFILAQPRLQFAAYIRGATPSAVAIPVSPIPRARMLPDGAFAMLVERNRARVSIRAGGGGRSAQGVRSDQAGSGEDISPEW